MVVGEAATPQALKILLLEDSADDAALLERNLRRGNLIPVLRRVQDEAEYLEALEVDWDIVLADYALPRFSGLDALRLLRAQDASTPFIMISGRMGKTTAREALRAGAQDYLVKDDLTRLGTAVTQAVATARARRQLRQLDHQYADLSRRLVAMMQLTTEAIVSVDAEQSICLFNRGAELMFQYGADEVLGQPLEILLPERHRAAHGGHVQAFAAELEPSRHKSRRRPILGRRKDGSEFPAEASITRQGEGRERFYTVFMRDISEQVANERWLRQVATTDPTTGLPNRAGFVELLEERLDAMRFRDARAAVVHFDVDRFRAINETFNHVVGDQLLCEVARRLRESLPANAVIGRVGSDEFAFVLTDAGQEQVEAVMARLAQNRTRTIAVAGHEFQLTASMGVALFPEHGEHGDELLRHCESALYRAKQTGGAGYRFYRREMTVAARDRAGLEAGLRRALERDELILYYQPQLDLRNGALHGFEALLRWQHPQLGLLPPGRFIELLEITGLVVPIGRWVLETAVAQQRAWASQGLGEHVMAVNLSVRQFSSKGLVQSVREVLRQSGVSASRLDLEITESMMVQDNADTHLVMRELYNLGCRISIDDFGTGYSSLGYLHRLPVHQLKVDRSFVRNLETDARSCEIVNAVLSLARRLHLKVVAEGIETDFQREYLRSRNCDYGQGFLFAKPLPVVEATAFIERLRA